LQAAQSRLWFSAGGNGRAFRPHIHRVIEAFNAATPGWFAEADIPVE
jgi:hypothetical protein